MPTIDLASSFYYILYYYKSRYNIDLIAPHLDARSLEDLLASSEAPAGECISGCCCVYAALRY